VLDLWFEKRFARGCEGKAYLIRYADDYVACFVQEAEARRFLTEMTQRLAEFDLEVEPSKTALLQFGSQALGRKARDARGPRTFRFLGFTHSLGRSRRGRFVVGTDTDRSNRPTAGIKGTPPSKKRSGKAVCGAQGEAAGKDLRSRRAMGLGRAWIAACR
jgi:hypothetical protein